MDVFETYNIFFRKYFPNLRKSQEDLLKQFEKIKDEHKIVDIEAPPGVGKSLVNLVIAFSEDNNFNDIYNKIIVSTHSKVLQRQYVNSFKKIFEDFNIPYAIGVGASTFPCKALNKRFDYCLLHLGLRCRHAPKIIEGPYRQLVGTLDLENCALFGFWLPFARDNPSQKVKAVCRNTECLYWLNEFKVHKSKIVFTNHHYLFYHILFSSSLPAPSVLIADESHRLPEVFSKIFALVIKEKHQEFLIREGIISSRKNIINFTGDYLTFIDFLEKIYDNFDHLTQAVKKIKGVFRVKLMKMLETLKLYYMLYRWASKRKIPLPKVFLLRLFNNDIKVNPTFPAYSMVMEYLASFVKNRVVFSSATPLPKERSVATVRLSSYADMFPPSRRPVLYIKDFPEITNKTITNEKVQIYILNLIENIWRYPNFRRIVIHSTNNFIKEYLGSLLLKYGYPTIITGENLQEDFEKWLEMPYGIIISAGLEEGVDLKDDIARVQIILKLPLFKLSNDPFMAWICKEDNLLYNYYIVRRIVQMSGRICRSHSDFGITFILDKRALNHYLKYINLYPFFYKVAVKIITVGMLPVTLSNLAVVLQNLQDSRFQL